MTTKEKRLLAAVIDRLQMAWGHLYPCGLVELWELEKALNPNNRKLPPVPIAENKPRNLRKRGK